MASVSRKLFVSSYADAWWILGTGPGGKYAKVSDSGTELIDDPEIATPYGSEKAASEALALAVPATMRGDLGVIRLSVTRTRRESGR